MKCSKCHLRPKYGNYRMCKECLRVAYSTKEWKIRKLISTTLADVKFWERINKDDYCRSIMDEKAEKEKPLW